MGRRSRVSKIKGLMKHPGTSTFWFRRVVPKDLRGDDFLGKREIKFTLNTSDLRKAEVLSAQHWIKWGHRFEDLRSGRDPVGLIPTDEDLARLATEWRDLWFKADALDDKSEIETGSEMGADGKLKFQTRPLSPEEVKERRRKRLVEWEDEIYKGNEKKLINTATDILKYSPEKFSTDKSVIDRFVPILSEAEYDAFLVQMNRIRGEPSREILERNPMEYVSNNMTLSKLLENYITSKQPRAQTETEWRTVFDRLIQVIGDKAIRKVSKHDVSKFIDKVARLPSRGRKAVKQLTVEEMISIAEREGMERVSTETIRKHVTAIRSVFSWAMDRDYVSVNPASRLAPKREPSGPKRLPFSQDDLLKIFDPNAYSEYPRHQADYWIPIICLFTGARIEEIAQLHKTDIRYEENVPIIEISPNRGSRDADDAKRVKNQASARTVPIHDELVKIGLLDFVAERRADSGIRLFPELKRNTNNRLSRSTSQRFARHLDRIGIKDPRKVFHSFRHTFKDACRNAGLHEDVHDRLTGHTSGSIGRYYGQGHNLPKLQEEINKVDYLGVLLGRYQ